MQKVYARRCNKCGSDDTYIQSNGTPSWFREIGSDGNWTGKWLCNKCYNKIQRQKPGSYHNVMKYLNQISKNAMKRRICCTCGNNQTHISRGVPQWFDHKCDKENCTKKLCHSCYMKVRDYSIWRKSCAKMRIMKVTIDRINNLSERELGFIGEDIVSTKLGIGNYNVDSDNFNSPFDHYSKEFERIDTKIRSLRYGKWEFLLGKNCDLHVLLAMDECIPWRKIERVYIIPDTKIDITGMTITKGVNSRWDVFLVDAKPYDDIYYKKYYLPYERQTLFQKKI